jgi:hypothetical protein
MCIHCYSCDKHNCPLCLCECWTHPFQCIDGSDCYNNHITTLANKLQTQYEDTEVDGYPTYSSDNNTPNQVSNQDDFLVDKPIKRQKRLANNNKPTGKNILTPPKKIRFTSPERTNVRSTIRRPKSQILSMITDIHQLRYAPEPLATMTSHFQLIHQSTNETSIWISLTNTSGRKIRPDIFQKTIRILYQYTKVKTFI